MAGQVNTILANFLSLSTDGSKRHCLVVPFVSEKDVKSAYKIIKNSRIEMKGYAEPQDWHVDYLVFETKDYDKMVKASFNKQIIDSL